MGNAPGREDERMATCGETEWENRAPSARFHHASFSDLTWSAPMPPLVSSSLSAVHHRPWSELPALLSRYDLSPMTTIASSFVDGTPPLASRVLASTQQPIGAAATARHAGSGTGTSQQELTVSCLLQRVGSCFLSWRRRRLVVESRSRLLRCSVLFVVAEAETSYWASRRWW